MSKRRLELLEAIKSSGWEIVRTRPGIYLASHPSSAVELPTPANIPERWWPDPTYIRLRQLEFNADPVHGVTFVQKREGVPWVGTTESTLTLTQAFAYLAADPD